MSAREAGLSLLETLVALFIVATLSTAGVALLSSTLDAREQFDARMERVREIELARAVLRDDLAQLARRAARDEEGGLRPHIFLGGGDGEDLPLLAFTRHGWENPSGVEARGSTAYVEYVVEEGALIRLSPLRVDPARQTPMSRRVLLTGIEEAEASFLTSGTWSRFFESGREHVFGDAFPDLVALDLTLEEMGPVRQFFLVSPAQ